MIVLYQNPLVHMLELYLYPDSDDPFLLILPIELVLLNLLQMASHLVDPIFQFQNPIQRLFHQAPYLE